MVDSDVKFLFLDIKKLCKNIEEVACSLPLCPTRRTDEKLLGGSVPSFYFALTTYLEENPEEKERKFLDRKRVEEIITFQHDSEHSLRCCCCRPDLSLQKQDIEDAIRFLNDTGND